MIKCSLITLAVVAVVLLNSGAEARRTRMRSGPVVSPVQCTDDSGRDVPWYIVYKSPFQLENPRDNGYFYIQSNLNTQEWTKSAHPIGDPKSMISRTLAPLYNLKAEAEGFLGYALYNDQPPVSQHRDAVSDSSSSTEDIVLRPGFTKGVVITSESGGIWMQHSVPNFPNSAGERYAYPSQALLQGQMFLCLSLDAADLNNTVAEIFKITNPLFYSSHFPADIAAAIPNLVRAVGLPIKQRVTPFASFVLRVSGTSFHVFPKSGRYSRDLYTDILNRKLRTSLKVQSYRTRIGSLPSNCSTHSDYNVLNVDATKLNNVEFEARTDNSKWVVGVDSDWSCVSDLNRMESQNSRGGAATCTSNSNVYHAFKKMVEDTEACRILGRQRRQSSSSEETRTVDSESDSWW